MGDDHGGCAEWEVSMEGGLGMGHCWQSVLTSPPALFLGGEVPTAELGVKPHTGAALPSELQPGRKIGSQMPNHSPRIQNTLGDLSGAPRGSPPVRDMLFGGGGVLYSLFFSVTAPPRG